MKLHLVPVRHGKAPNRTAIPFVRAGSRIKTECRPERIGRKKRKGYPIPRQTLKATLLIPSKSLLFPPSLSTLSPPPQQAQHIYSSDNPPHPLPSSPQELHATPQYSTSVPGSSSTLQTAATSLPLLDSALPSLASVPLWVEAGLS